MIECVCRQCGIQFESYPSRNSKFCSLRCAYDNPERIATTASKQRKYRGTSICIGCGTEFLLTTKGGTKYCSQPCAASTIGRTNLAKNRHISPRTKYVVRSCPTCDMMFGSWQTAKRIYCSPKCAGSNVDHIKRRLTAFHARKNKVKIYSRCPKQWVELGERRFFARSKWEANYGRYLEMLRLRGEIRDWRHEPKTFWFDEIKRGVRSYLPDFWVMEQNRSEHYHEVKGWMDARSATKLKRMKKYHPSVSVILIGEKWFKANSKILRYIVPGWQSS